MKQQLFDFSIRLTTACPGKKGAQGEERFTPFDIIAVLIFIRSARISRNFTLPSPATGSGRAQFFATLSAFFPRWAINADIYHHKLKTNFLRLVIQVTKKTVFKMNTASYYQLLFRFLPSTPPHKKHTHPVSLPEVYPC